MARIPGGAFDSAAVTRLEDSQLCWHPPPILGSITCYARTVEDALQTNVWYWCGLECLEVENIISHLAFDRNLFYPLQQHMSVPCQAFETSVFGVTVGGAVENTALRRNWSHPSQHPVYLAQPLKSVCLVLVWPGTVEYTAFESN